MRRLCVVIVLTAMVATAATAAELWIDRVEVGGRLLVPLRGVFEAVGATVNYYPAAKGIEITRASTVISMYVNNTQAFINGQVRYLDVAPKVVRGSTYIPLRFAGEALGMAVEYQGNQVVMSGGGGETLILHIASSPPPPPPPPPPANYGEILPQSNDRNLTNADLSGYSNWQLTLARNEIYARHGRPFDNSQIRSYFLNTGWYSPNSGYRESWLTGLESRNATFILNYQKAVFGAAATRP